MQTTQTKGGETVNQQEQGLKQQGQLGQGQGQGQLGLLGVQLGEGQLEKFQAAQSKQGQGQLGQGQLGQGQLGQGQLGQGQFGQIGRRGRLRGRGRGRGRGGRGGFGRRPSAVLQYYKQLADSKQHGPSKNVLLTGPPQSGKTTIMNKIVELLNSCKDEVCFTGFLTTEIRTGVVRQGFQIIPIGEASKSVQPWVLGHMNLTGDTSTPVVSKYGVDVEDFTKNISGCFQFKDMEDKLKVVLIDEIGMMECMSEVFQKEVKRLLDDEDILVIATVGQRGHAFMDEVRQRQDVDLRVLTSVADAVKQNLPQELFDNVCQFLDEVEDDEEIPEEEITGKLKDTSISSQGGEKEGISKQKQGSTQGSTQQGSTQQGSTQQGSTQQGSTQQGSTQQGSTQQGSTQQK